MSESVPPINSIAAGLRRVNAGDAKRERGKNLTCDWRKPRHAGSGNS
jgi:hypothetical protein